MYKWCQHTNIVHTHKLYHKWNALAVTSMLYCIGLETHKLKAMSLYTTTQIKVWKLTTGRQCLYIQPPRSKSGNSQLIGNVFIQPPRSKPGNSQMIGNVFIYNHPDQSLETHKWQAMSLYNHPDQSLETHKW